MKSKVLRNSGLSLIEMMIVVAIIGILSAIAYPSYIDYIQEGRRNDAKEHLMLLAQKMEEYRAKHLTYEGAQTAQTGGIYPESIPVGSAYPFYRLRVTVDNKNRYIIQARPESGSPMADDKCGILEYNSSSDTKRALKLIGGGVISNCW